MIKYGAYNISLFVIALAIALSSTGILVDTPTFLKVLIVFWFFSSLYYRLRGTYKKGNTSIDYGINYDLAMVVIAGPMGLFIFESIYRFTVYFYKKWTKTADQTEFLDTFYNIGTFVITHSFAYLLFQLFYDRFQNFPFGFWILTLMLVCIASYLSGTIMLLLFMTMGERRPFKEAIDFIFRDISMVDYGKVAISNGLLILFLQEGKWEMIISLFILNYIVSLSVYSKAQSIQNKLERDQFEQMAYTDFLTGVSNRTFMDKKMAELSESGENIGIVVADIDNFKAINDSYNHAVGDKVIQHFAGTLKSYLSEDDFLFRSGGEEFTLCLRMRGFTETIQLVEKIPKQIINNAVHVEYKGEMLPISYTASFGLYYYKANEKTPMEKAYIQADELMYHSKQLGKNHVSVLNGLQNVKVVQP